MVSTARQERALTLDTSALLEVGLEPALRRRLVSYVRREGYKVLVPSPAWDEAFWA